MSAASPVEDLVGGFQDLVGQVPEFAQPFIVALAGAVPFIEGEGASAIGIIGGIHPIVAALAAITGNLLAVVAVVLLSSRARSAAVAHQKRRASAATAQVGTDGSGATMVEAPTDTGSKPESKGRQKFRRWVVRFGVPGASLLGPLAIPTHFTASMLVASGVRTSWVILWQAIAIVLWTGVITAIAAGVVGAVGA